MLILGVIFSLILIFSRPAWPVDPNGVDTLFINCTPPDYYAAESMKVSFDLCLKTDNSGAGNEIIAMQAPLMIMVSNNLKAKARIDSTVARVFSSTAVEGWNIKTVNIASNAGSTTSFPLDFVLGAVNFSTPGLSGPAIYTLAHLKFMVKDTCTICIDIDSYETPLCLRTFNSGCYSPQFAKSCCQVTTTSCVAKAGDLDEDMVIGLNDLIFLSNFLFKLGPAPIPLCRGDYNGDTMVNFTDVFYAINYLFKMGPGPKKSGVCCL